VRFEFWLADEPAMTENVRITIPETTIVPGRRLGRHINHDPRSRNFAFTAPTPIVTTTHMRFMPILDQGSVGSCTGNATVGALGTTPLWEVLPARTPLTEAEALILYSDATKIDSAVGSYPPDDTGSDGLSVAKVALRRGLISAYAHAFTLQDALSALMTGPVITGVGWYEGFDSPDANGLVAISGNVRGGHEFVVYAVDATAKTVTAANSWGTSYGKEGCFTFSWDTWQRLMDEQGDVTVLLPLKAPDPIPAPVPPAPTPVPAETADDVFARQLHIWVDKMGLCNRKVQGYAKIWLAARGL